MIYKILKAESYIPKKDKDTNFIISNKTIYTKRFVEVELLFFFFIFTFLIKAKGKGILKTYVVEKIKVDNAQVKEKNKNSTMQLIFFL